MRPLGLYLHVLILPEPSIPSPENGISYYMAPLRLGFSVQDFSHWKRIRKKCNGYGQVCENCVILNQEVDFKIKPFCTTSVVLYTSEPLLCQLPTSTKLRPLLFTAFGKMTIQMQFHVIFPHFSTVCEAS